MQSLFVLKEKRIYALANPTIIPKIRIVFIIIFTQIFREFNAIYTRLNSAVLICFVSHIWKDDKTFRIYNSLISLKMKAVNLVIFY